MCRVLQQTHSQAMRVPVEAAPEAAIVVVTAPSPSKEEPDVANLEGGKPTELHMYWESTDAQWARTSRAGQEASDGAGDGSGGSDESQD